jgi:hypothetical protein
LVTIYADRGYGYLQIWQSVFDRRAPTCSPIVESVLGAPRPIKQGNTTRRISGGLLTVKPGSSARFWREPRRKDTCAHLPPMSRAGCRARYGA